MTVKVLVTSAGQQIISEVKQVENKESKEVIAYWVINPRVVTYNLTEEEQVNVNFAAYCLVSNENEFSIKADHVVSILEPRGEVLDRYNEVVGNNKEEEEVTDESDTADSEDRSNADSAE